MIAAARSWDSRQLTPVEMARVRLEENFHDLDVETENMRARRQKLIVELKKMMREKEEVPP